MGGNILVRIWVGWEVNNIFNRINPLPLQDFYCFLLWPFIETYWLAAVSLFSLVQDTALATHIEPGAWVDERVFLNRCQFFGKTIYYEGDLSYFESVNIETIKNALKRLRDNNMIITHSSVALPPRIPVQSVKRSFDQQQQKPQQDSSPNPHPAPSSPPSSSTPSAAPEKGTKTWIALHPDWVPPPLPPVAVLQRQLQLKKQRASVQTNATSASQPQAPRPPSSPSSLHPNFPLEEEKDDINLQAWYSLNPQGRLWDFCERIGRYRREGKNRRDTATVAIRVLRLARISAHWVFDAAGKKKPQPAGQQQVATVASKSKL